MTAADTNDWSAHDDLADALRAYLRDGDLALDDITGVVDPQSVLAFTCERVATLNTVTSTDESLWQEVALTDGTRLILWHGDDESDELTGEPIFVSSLRTIPLSSIVDQGLRARYDLDPDGGRSQHTVTLYLATQTPERSTTELSDNAGTTTTQFVETYRFSKSVTDGGPGQMERLVQFSRVLSRSMAAPAAGVDTISG